MSSLLFHLKPPTKSSIGADCKWRNDTNMLAVSVPGSVTLYDRQGTFVASIPVDNNQTKPLIDWDSDGNFLAVASPNSSQFILWESSSSQSSTVASHRPITCLAWSKKSSVLAIGTDKGLLSVYNPFYRRLDKYLGKHQKKISLIQWSSSNILVMVSEDKTVSISKADDFSNVRDNFQLPSVPSFITFISSKFKGKMIENGIACCAGTLYFFSITENLPPRKLATEQIFVSSLVVLPELFIVLGTDTGHVSVVSLRQNEADYFVIDKLIRHHLIRTSPVLSLSHCTATSRAAHSRSNSTVSLIAIVYEETVELMSTLDWSLIAPKSIIPTETDLPYHRAYWGRDGGILTVSTASGHVYSEPLKVPVLVSAHDTLIASMTSLAEVTVFDCALPPDIPPGSPPIPVFKVNLPQEPSFIRLGPQSTLASCINSVAHFFIGPPLSDVPTNSPAEMTLVSQREYVSEVESICLNSSVVCVKLGKKALLHSIHQNTPFNHVSDVPTKDQWFPLNDAEEIGSISMNEEFLIFGTNIGIHVFSLMQNSIVSDIHLPKPVVALYPNQQHTRMITVDCEGSAYFVNPVDNSFVVIPEFPSSCASILWDPMDSSLFGVVDKNNTCTPFLYSQYTLNGPTVSPLISGVTPLSSLAIPLVLFNGDLFSFIEGFGLSSITLNSHSAVMNSTGRLAQAFDQLIELRRLREAWVVALQLKEKKYYTRLLTRALHSLDLTTAELSAREQGDAGTVLAIRSLTGIESVSLLSASCALLLDDVQLAMKNYQDSGLNSELLQLYIDLHDWENALNIASYCDPQRIPFISMSLAKKLELDGCYEQALVHYQKALQGGEALSRDQLIYCQNNVIKCELRCGNVEVAEKAYKSTDKKLISECAAILASMKHYVLSAKLYRRCSDHENSVSLLLKANEVVEAAKYIQAVRNPKLLVQFGHVAEQIQRYNEAAGAYQKAGAVADYVRLLLYKLDDPTTAFKVARESGDVLAGSTVAKYCEENGEIKIMIEFLLLTGDSERACELAIKHNHPELAASYYQSVGQYHRALKIFLQIGAIEDAINVVAESNSDILIRTMFDFLMGDSDGVAKDVRHLFTLYAKLKHYVQAAKTALIIAGQEIESGQYLDARDTLYVTLSKIKRVSAGYKLPTKLYGMLRNLHSYVITKYLIRREKHELAAGLLIKVVDNDLFAQHKAQLLISTIVECQKAGLKESSFQYATRLMQPDLVDEIPAQYKSKIEKVIRKREKTQSDVLSQTTSCPFCSHKMSLFDVHCEHCKSLVPFCIVTGSPIVKDDLTTCPHCTFPALYSEFVQHLEHFSSCPMCKNDLVAADLEYISEVSDIEAVLTMFSEWFSGKGDETEQQDLS
ncbi:hypothetical protein RCL1_007042 [Eukaryota sp. TZLM3-RCL]